MKTITVKALGLTGPEWIKRLEKNKYHLSSYTKDVLNSPDWERERMEKRTEVSVALVTVKDMGKEWATTKEIQEYAASKGYEMPKGELSLLIRETISDKEMEALGVWYIAALHSPITHADGRPRVLYSDRNDVGRWVLADWGNPGNSWDADGAFAFGVPASTQDSVAQPERLDTENLELPKHIEANFERYGAYIMTREELEDITRKNR